MTDKVLSIREARMIMRAPKGPLPFSPEDRAYIAETLHGMQTAFGLAPFARVAPGQWSARALLEHLVEWWHDLIPTTESERQAFTRVLGTIRLIDAVSMMVADRDKTRAPR